MVCAKRLDRPGRRLAPLASQPTANRDKDTLLPLPDYSENLIDRDANGTYRGASSCEFSGNTRDGRVSYQESSGEASVGKALKYDSPKSACDLELLAAFELDEEEGRAEGFIVRQADNEAVISQDNSSGPRSPTGKGEQAMNGTILDYSVQTSSGLITGDDGNRYNFVGAEWKDQAIPNRGTRVDFEAQGGDAVAVYRAMPAPSAGGIGGTLDGVLGSERTKVVAGLLGILLGWAGAHKFYLGIKRPQ